MSPVTVACFALLYIYSSLGVGHHLLALPNTGSETFTYPLNVNLKDVVEKKLMGKDVEVDVINEYPHNFIAKSLVMCSSSQKYDVVILVKSAFMNFDQRNAIRQTYGREHHVQEINLKTVFFIGKDIDKNAAGNIISQKIALESRHFKDVIQLDFPDSMNSSTNKTMMALRWAVQYCGQNDYYLVLEDDMYLSVINLVNFIRDDNPAEFPNIPATESANASTKTVRKIFFGGHVKNSALLKLKNSPFSNYTSVYPWWPAYVANGAYVLSNRAIKLLYLGSLYVQHFSYDDVFLGIVAYRLQMNLTHSNRFVVDKGPFSREAYRKIISSHGFNDQEELINSWQSQYY